MAAQGFPADLFLLQNTVGDLFDQLNLFAQQVGDRLLLSADELLDGTVEQPLGQLLDADDTKAGEPEATIFLATSTAWLKSLSDPVLRLPKTSFSLTAPPSKTAICSSR